MKKAILMCAVAVAAAMLTLAGLLEPKTAFDEVLPKNGVRDLSAFTGHFVPEATCVAKNADGTLRVDVDAPSDVKVSR